MSAFINLNGCTVYHIILRRIGPFLSGEYRRLIARTVARARRPMRLLVSIQKTRRSGLRHDLQQRLLVRRAIRSLLGFFVNAARKLARRAGTYAIVVRGRSVVIFIVNRSEGGPNDSRILQSRHFFRFLFSNCSRSTLSGRSFEFFKHPLLAQPSKTAAGKAPSVPVG